MQSAAGNRQFFESEAYSDRRGASRDSQSAARTRMAKLKHDLHRFVVTHQQSLHRIQGYHEKKAHATHAPHFGAGLIATLRTAAESKKERVPLPDTLYTTMNCSTLRHVEHFIAVLHEPSAAMHLFSDPWHAANCRMVRCP